MHTYYEVKEMLHRELEKIVKKGELSAGSLDTIDKLLNSIKNSCKIIMYDEYDDGYSQDSGMTTGGNSYAQRRDSMGRYSRRGYSNARGGRGYSRASGYSYDDGRSEKAEMLREMMDEASSEDERKIISRLLRRMENE